MERLLTGLGRARAPGRWLALFRPLVSHYRGALVYVVALSVTASLLEGIGITLFIPLLQALAGEADAATSGFLSGRLEGAIPELGVAAVVALMLLCILLKQVATYASSSAFAATNLRVGHQLRMDVLDQFLAVSPRYVRQRSSGELINTLAGETWRTTAALSDLAGVIASACTVLIFTIILLLISWQLTLAVLLGSAIIAVLVRAVTARLRSLSREAVQVSQKLTVSMWESLLGIDVIRLFDQRREFRTRFERLSEDTRRTFMRMELLSNLSTPVFEMSSAILLLTMLPFLISTQAFSVPVLVAYSVLLYRLQPQIRHLVNGWVSLESKSGALEDVLGFLSRDDKPYLINGPTPFARLQHDVVFREVVYRHEPDLPPALAGVNLRIPRGSLTAIVGLSGAGKSTVAELLCRNDDPSEGEILVDGVPLQQIRLEDWRSRLGVVSQDVFLFGASVRDNIAFGHPDASDAEVEEAARQAHASEFIDLLPQRFDTMLGDRGMRLSGGQRQRIALARAILRQPDILILDEATNALDTLSERLISDALAEFRTGRTVVAIAHRLSTIEDADQVFVIEAGQVVEQGTPAELREQGGLFATLHQLQMRTAELVRPASPER